jgi:hypothetical protein
MIAGTMIARTVIAGTVIARGGKLVAVTLALDFVPLLAKRAARCLWQILDGLFLLGRRDGFLDISSGGLSLP